MNDAFWRDVARCPGLRVPRCRAEAAWGVPAVDAARAAGLVDLVAFEEGAPFPCACGACRARLLRESGRWAVVSDGPLACPDEALDEAADEGVQVLPSRLVRVLARAAGLDVAPPASWRDPVMLGTRVLAGRRVGFVWVPQTAQVNERLRVLAHEEPNRDLVALVPHRSAVPSEGGSPIGGVRVFWLDVGTHLFPDRDDLRLDLADVALAGPAPDGRELWPRYALVVDEARGRAWWGGRALPLDRTPLGARMLFELARRPGAWVTRRELMLALWPEEFSSRTRAPVDPIALDRRLRQLRSALGEVVAAVGPVAGLPEELVENLRTRSDTDGGYRLNVDAISVCHVP